MQLDWIWNPVTQCSFTAAALAVSICFLISSRLALHKLERLQRESKEQFESRLELACASIEQLRSALDRVTEQSARTIPGAALDLIKRARAVQMSRRGESLETIAGAMRLPRNEVALLLKLQNVADVQQR